MLLGTTRTYTKTQLIAILNNSTSGDASLILANQLIAAKLNIANGATASQAVQDAIAAADAAIGTKAIPMRVKTNTTLGRTMTSLAATLERYNVGMLNSGCYTGAVLTLAAQQTEVQPLEGPSVQNYPNPFRSVTSIRYTIPVDAPVNLSVYNQVGQKIAVLANGKQMAGTHTVMFHAANKPAGIYLYQLQTLGANGEVIVLNGKMLLSR
jgi:hypothetical protein